MTAEHLAFVDTVVALEAAFQPCVVMGEQVVGRGHRPAVGPDPFPVTFCSCGEERQRVLAFHAKDRLWCLDFCFHCGNNSHTGALQSRAVSDLPAGTWTHHTVELQTRTVPFFINPEDGRWQETLVATGLAGWSEEEQELLLDAAATHFGCANAPGQSPKSFLHALPVWIQYPLNPACPICQEPMVFLAQIEEDLGFRWGDSGAAYLFHCPHHPDEGFVEAQMC